MTDQNDFIKLLFDTLKETTEDNTDAIRKLFEQQLILVSTVEKMPIIELKKALEDHHKDSTDDIGACTETVESETKSILEKINELTNKVKLMIGIVAAAVAFTGVVYIVGRFLVDYHIPKQDMVTIQKNIEEQQLHEHKKLIEAVRLEIKKLHPEIDKQDKLR